MKMNKPQFCVIAPTASGRKWFHNVEDATRHATSILGYPATSKDTVLFVVEAVRRVERAAPPVRVTVLPEGDHPHIGYGWCPICKHYGEDCTGTRSVPA